MRLFNVTVRDEIGPAMPETAIVDVTPATPSSGMTMFDEFAKRVSGIATGLYVYAKKPSSRESLRSEPVAMTRNPVALSTGVPETEGASALIGLDPALDVLPEKDATSRIKATIHTASVVFLWVRTDLI